MQKTLLLYRFGNCRYFTTFWRWIQAEKEKTGKNGWKCVKNP